MNEPLDRHRLADVLRGNAMPAAAFLAGFRHATDADIEELRAAVGQQDVTRAAQLAHRVEGASRVIGARPFAEACSQLAGIGPSGDAAVLRQAFALVLERKQALYASMEMFWPGLPVAAAPRAPAPGVDSQPVCGDLVFLVVEDHEFQRAVIMRLLRQLGALEVTGFADGASALAAARGSGTPAIMVLDLAMPALNGMEVMRIAAQEGLPLSFVMNSALASDLLSWPLHTARSYGATVLGAISKPLTAAKLAPLLAQHRHGQRPGAPSPVKRA